MRIIKFRIWNNLTKEFTFELPKEFHFTHKRFDIQQFVGLLDKNGKEIYEGDIIKYKFICLGGTDIIIFRDGKFELKNSFIESEGYRSVKNISENCEIIGNIYEMERIYKLRPDLRPKVEDKPFNMDAVDDAYNQAINK